MTAWNDGRREDLRLAETKTTVASNHPARRSSPSWTSAHPPRRLETPALLPVVNPNIRTIEPRVMWDKYGIQALITNSYIMWKHDDLRSTAQSEGVHALLDFPGVIMTDSGTFQSYVYGDVEVGVDEIVAFQRTIGVDIATMLDVFSRPDMKATEVEDAVRQTDARAAQSLEAAQDTMLNGRFKAVSSENCVTSVPNSWAPIPLQSIPSVELCPSWNSSATRNMRRS